MMKRIGARFAWIEPRRRALAYLCGLLAFLFFYTVYKTGATPGLLPLTMLELPRLLLRLVGLGGIATSNAPAAIIAIGGRIAIDSGCRVLGGAFDLTDD
jgi:hypothetical protein